MVAVTFVHLDLGIGGAERLIIDAAVALKKKKHSVRIITTHHDQSHCFHETIDGTIPVTVVGDWLPRSVFRRCAALCSYFRMIYAAIYLIFFSNVKTDVVICDQVSACVPILRYKIHKVVFYCHFPDMLLSKRGNFLKYIYRLPLDYWEEKSTEWANVILVNSEFTKTTFRNTFKSISVVPQVVYPSINDKHLEQVYQNCDNELLELKLEEYQYFLSVNRYERKKNIELAIEAFAILQCKLEPDLRRRFKLVIAGGYDSDLEENISYYKELRDTAEKLKIDKKVIFLKSPSEYEKIKLMKYCRSVLYTPSNEHFGIVPLEAMFCRKPVIAVNSGGPTETVLHRETGLLCQSDSNAFAEAMYEIISNEKFAFSLGIAARNRFEKCFSFEAFSDKLNTCVLR